MNVTRAELGAAVQSTELGERDSVTLTPHQDGHCFVSIDGAEPVRVRCRTGRKLHFVSVAELPRRRLFELWPVQPPQLA